MEFFFETYYCLLPLVSWRGPRLATFSFLRIVCGRSKPSALLAGALQGRLSAEVREGRGADCELRVKASRPTILPFSVATQTQKLGVPTKFLSWRWFGSYKDILYWR